MSLARSPQHLSIEALDALNSLHDAVNQGKNHQEISKLLAEEIRAIFPSFGVVVYLLSKHKNCLEMQNVGLATPTISKIEKLIRHRIPLVEIPLKPGSPYKKLLSSHGVQVLDDKDTIHQMMSQFADAVYSTEKEHNQLLKLLPKIQSIIGIKTIICSPLVFNDEVVGLLEISSKQHPKSQDITRLETVLKQIAAIFYRKHKEDELHLQVDQQQSLAVLSQALSESLDTQTMLRVALEQVLAITKVDGAECHLVDENSELALAATLGLDENFVAQSHDFRFPIGRGIPGRTFAARAPVYVPDATSDDRYWRKNLAQKAGYRSLLCIPIIAREIPFGTIMVYSRAAHDYYNHEKTILMAMGWQLAVALDRARFFDAEQQRAAELSRSNALISALGQVAARIDSTPDPNQIMATLGSELQGLGLKYIYLSLSPEIESLTVRYHSLPSEIITDLKKQFGMIVRDMQLTRGNCPYYEKLIDQKESVFLLDELSPNNPDFPPFLIAMINYSVKLNGLNSSVPVMILPLISDVRVVGVLIIWGATLQQEDLPAISIFASQLAASLEVAYLHEQLKIQRVTEQNILLNLSQTLNALNEPDEILTASAQIAQQTLQVELVAQLVPDPSNQRLVLRSGAGWQADMYGSFSMDMAASIEGRVMQTRQACQQIYSGTSPAHENPPELGRQGIESGLIVPLIAGDTALGVLCAYSYQPRQFSPDDVRLLSLIASNTAQALKRAELYWNTKRHAIELEFLADLSAGLRATSTTQQLIDYFLEKTTEIAAGPAASNIYFVDPESQDLICQGWYPPAPDLVGLSLPMGKGITGHVAQTGEIYFTDDLSKDPKALILPLEAARLNPARGNISLPLRSQDCVIGVMHIVLYERHIFTEEEVRLLTAVSEIAGSALVHSRTQEKLEENFVQTVLALVNTVDARDQYTNNHSQRLASWAEKIAVQLGCSAEETLSIYWGALLHDLGKIGIPDDILLKVGPLSEDEWAIIKRHPQIGAEIIAPIKSLENVVPIIRAHHEKYDGTGYCAGLKGEEIPIGARIIAVVDAYGAITEDRSYREGRSHLEAIAEIKRCAGTCFDPQIVEIFASFFSEDLSK